MELGTTTGDPEMLGTCGRDAAFGLEGLTAPGMDGWLAAGFPVVPGGLEGAEVIPGGFVCAVAEPTKAKAVAKSRTRRAVFHIDVGSF